MRKPFKAEGKGWEQDPARRRQALAGLLGGSPSPATEHKGQKSKAETANKNQKETPHLGRKPTQKRQTVPAS